MWWEPFLAKPFGRLDGKRAWLAVSNRQRVVLVANRCNNITVLQAIVLTIDVIIIFVFIIIIIVIIIIIFHSSGRRLNFEYNARDTAAVHHNNTVIEKYRAVPFSGVARFIYEVFQDRWKQLAQCARPPPARNTWWNPPRTVWWTRGATYSRSNNRYLSTVVKYLQRSAKPVLDNFDFSFWGGGGGSGISDGYTIYGS